MDSGNFWMSVTELHFVKGKKERDICGMEAKLAQVVRFTGPDGEMLPKGSIVTVVAQGFAASDSKKDFCSRSAHGDGELHAFEAISGSKCPGTPKVLAFLDTDRGRAVILSGNCLCT
jgi:hypothetical protein